jgi:similar to spore coat protein
MSRELATHEKLELHEILTLKTACATKAVAMLELAEDEKLKKLLKEDVESSVNAIEELREILEKDK